MLSTLPKKRQGKEKQASNQGRMDKDSSTMLKTVHDIREACMYFK